MRYVRKGFRSKQAYSKYYTVDTKNCTLEIHLAVCQLDSHAPCCCVFFAYGLIVKLILSSTWNEARDSTSVPSFVAYYNAREAVFTLRPEADVLSSQYIRAVGVTPCRAVEHAEHLATRLSRDIVSIDSDCRMRRGRTR